MEGVIFSVSSFPFPALSLSFFSLEYFLFLCVQYSFSHNSSFILSHFSVCWPVSLGFVYFSLSFSFCLDIFLASISRSHSFVILSLFDATSLNPSVSLLYWRMREKNTYSHPFWCCMHTILWHSVLPQLFHQVCRSHSVVQLQFG